MRALGFVFMVLATPAAAQDFDPRVQTMELSAGGISPIPTASGATQLLLFARGERIQSVALSIPGAYLVDIASSGDSLTLRANGTPAPVLMTVATDRRRYDLELVPAAGRSAPAVVRFSENRRPPVFQPPMMMPSALPSDTSWRVTGDKTLRPDSIKDDGRKTYIAWKEDQPLPAVFALGPKGEAEMVEGYVRANVFTIDRVPGELEFRIDDRKAIARRVVSKKPQK